MIHAVELSGPGARPCAEEREWGAALWRTLREGDLLYGSQLASWLRAAECAALRGVYRADVRFYVCGSPEMPGAALLHVGDVGILCDNGLEDTQELGELVACLGCRSLWGTSRLLAPCGIGGIHMPGAPVMVYRGSPPDAEPEVVCVNENLHAVYALLEGEPASYDSWLADQRFREREGLCSIWAILERGEPVATATIAGVRDDGGVIGSVATRGDRRRRGYAGALVRTLSALLLAEGRTPVLACADKSLARYYRALGFVQSGEWMRISF